MDAVRGDAGTGRLLERSTAGRLFAYRAFAYLTGVLLFVLIFVAVPIKYIGLHPLLAQVLGVVHGFLYMGYIVVTLVLAERCRWKPGFAVLVLLAGTIPLASFVAERRVTRAVREQLGTAAR